MRSFTFCLFLFLLPTIVTLSSCKKYLDKKPEDELATPESISDLQGLLDDFTVINTFDYAAEILSDDYFLFPSDWTAVSGQGNDGPLQKNLYIWKRDSTTNTFWNNIYRNISITNVVLDELPDMDYDPEHPAAYNNVKGSALFLRAFYFYHLAQLFAKPYNKNTVSSDLGIVLRLTPDVEETSVRASVKATYDQIISDLKSAIPLLPLKPLVNNNLIKTRPGLPAAYGALARTYLAMKEYDSAGRYADLCLSLHDSLMNYNSLDASNITPISRYNPEVIFAAKSNPINTFIGTRARIDSNLYRSYSDSDLRKKVFFRANTGTAAGTYAFKGDYDGIGNPVNTFFSFTGIVSDEMYLIKAECLARNNSIAPAMGVLNTLLQTRYETGKFTSLSATTTIEALTIILKERRKELLRRGARWTDIKRFMDDDQFRILPQRIINSQTYSMTTTNTPYLMLLPKRVVELSGMPQN